MSKHIHIYTKEDLNKVFKENNNIDELSIFLDRLTHEDIKIIADRISNNSINLLCVRSIGNSYVYNDSVQQKLSSLFINFIEEIKNCNIDEIKINNVPIDEQVLSSVANFLKYNKHTVSLTLWTSLLKEQISYNNFKKIAEALKENNSLMYLRLPKVIVEKSPELLTTISDHRIIINKAKKDEKLLEHTKNMIISMHEKRIATALEKNCAPTKSIKQILVFNSYQNSLKKLITKGELLINEEIIADHNDYLNKQLMINEWLTYEEQSDLVKLKNVFQGLNNKALYYLNTALNHSRYLKQKVIKDELNDVIQDLNIRALSAIEDISPVPLKIILKSEKFIKLMNFYLEDNLNSSQKPSEDIIESIIDAFINNEGSNIYYLFEAMEKFNQEGEKFSKEEIKAITYYETYPKHIQNYLVEIYKQNPTETIENLAEIINQDPDFGITIEQLHSCCNKFLNDKSSISSLLSETISYCNKHHAGNFLNIEDFSSCEILYKDHSVDTIGQNYTQYSDSIKLNVKF